MLTRMETIKLGKYFEDETQSLSDVEKILSKSTINIKLRDSTNSFREMGSVIAEVATKWDSLNETDQSATAAAIAGTRQRENFITLMRNWEQFQKAEEVQTEANGLAWQRYGIYMESVEATANKFKASWEKLASSLITNDLIKGIYNLGITFMDVIDKVGFLGVALGGLVGYLEYTTVASGQMTLSLTNLFTAETLAAAGATLLSVATGAIFAAGTIAAVYLLTNAFKELNKSAEDTYSTFQKHMSVNKESSDELKSLETSYASIAKKEEKSADDKKQLLDMQIALNEKFNDSGKTIDIYTGAVENNTEAINKNIAKLKELEIAKAESNLILGKEEYDEAVKYLEKTERLIDTKLVKRPGTRGVVTKIDFTATGTPDELLKLLAEEITAGKDVDGTLKNQYETLLKQVETYRKIKNEYEAQLKISQELKQDDYGMYSAEIKERMAQLAREEALANYDLAKAVEVLGTKVKNSTTIYSDYVSSNELSVESIAKLKETFPDYLDLLSIENGHLKLNTDAYKEKTLAIVDAEIATAKEALALDESNTELQDNISILKAYKNQVLESFQKVDLEQQLKEETEAVKKKTDALKDQEEQYKKQVEAEIEYYQDQIDALEDNAKAYQDSIEDQIDAAEKKKDALKDAEDAYQESIDDTIEKLKEENDVQKELLEAQLDGYKNIIDARIRILDLQQSEKEYQDEIAEKNESISDIQSQLLSLQFDTSDEANAKRLELQDELAEQQKDLSDTQYDYSIDTQKDALEKEYDDYEDMIQAKLDLLESSNEQQIAILEAQEEAYTANHEAEIEALDATIDKMKEEEEAYNEDIENRKAQLNDFIEVARDNLDAYTESIDGQIDTMNDNLEAIQNKALELPQGFDNFTSAVGVTNSKLNETNAILDTTKQKINEIGNAFSAVSTLSTGATTYSANENVAGYADTTSTSSNLTSIWSIITQLLGESLGTLGTGIGFVHHSGVNSGTASGKTPNSTAKEFISLLEEDEVVVNDSQMTNFMKNTLPNLTGISNTNSAGLTMEKFMDINVQGNLDSSVIPELEKVVDAATNKLVKSLSQRGIIRSPNTFSV